MPQWNGENQLRPGQGGMNFPEGGAIPGDMQMPEGFDPANMPNIPADMPQGGFGGGRPGGNRGPGAPTATEKFFTISYGKENYFYGVGELVPQ
jgi:hypothetical protein